MSMLRLCVLRSTPSTLFTRTTARTLRRTTSQPCLRLGQQNTRRSYASAGDAGASKTSDLPWAAAGVLLTTVGTYLALQPSSGAGGHHDEHHEEHKEKEEGESEEKSDDADEEKSDDKEEKSEGEDKSGDGDDSEEKKEKSEDDSAKDEPKDGDEEPKDDSNSGEDDSAKSSGDDVAKLHKGMTKQQGDIRKSESADSQGSNKKRIDSPVGKTIGEGASSGEGFDEGMQKTQKGLSNTDTKHSTDPHADSGKSSKGEGTVDTAKIKGTVKVDRKQV